MVTNRRIINEDIVSFTHFGQPFVNHEWLSQVSFFFFWDRFGPLGLLLFKLLIFSLIFHTCHRTSSMLGLAFFAVFLVAENVKQIWRVGGGPGQKRRGGVGGLNVCFLGTLIVMALNPYGLRSYGHFLVLASGGQGADSIV